MIPFALRENLLTADLDDCMAQVVSEKAQIFTQDKIDAEIIKRGGISEAALAAVRQAEKAVYADIIADGGVISTDLFSTSFSISGVFTNQADNFDPKRHVVNLNVNAGVLLKEAAKKAKPFKKEGGNTDPYITQVKDSFSGDTQSVKAGSIMEILGSRLKFDKTDGEQGVFVKASDGKEYRCSNVVETKPARAVVQLPAEVPAGEFTLEVRTKVNANKTQSKSLKIGEYSKILTAVQA